MDLFKQSEKKAASIPEAEVNIPAPNYGPSENPQQMCGNCIHYNEQGACNAFNFNCSQDHVCDAWQSAA